MNDDSKKPKGKVLVVVGWVLIIFSILAFLSSLNPKRYHRDPYIELFLNQPSIAVFAGVLGYIAGRNIINFAILILGLISWRAMKNKFGKIQTIISIILVILHTARAFIA